MAAMQWLKDQKNIYFGNASSVRDYRAQLRGLKAALFWAAYLGLMIIVVTISYSTIVSQGERSVTQTQSELQSFYTSVVLLLEAMVILVAPVIVAMSIQAERQRKSLDLIMTAPVSPKYFLIGKVFSGYRYILMLLFLSLPVAAAAVVLGGVTWSEVLITYLLVASHGLLYIAISLPIATLSQKVVPTVLYSYIACWVWGLGISVPMSAAYMFGGMGGMGKVELPFIMLLFPSGVFVGATSYTTIFSTQVPNWILAVGTILLMTKMFMLGAGSALTRIGSKETVSLRIHGLLVTFFLTFVFVYSLGSFGGPGATGMGLDTQAMAVMISLFTIPFVFVLPNLAAWSYNGERKNKPGALFNFKSTLSAAPEGGLPYLWSLIGSVIVATWLAGKATGEHFQLELVPYMIWLAGAWTFLWTMGWLISSFTNSGVATARKSHVAFTLIIALLPWPVLAILDLWLEFDISVIYPLRALEYGTSEIGTVIAMGLEFWFLAAIAAYWGEIRRKRTVSSIERGM